SPGRGRGNWRARRRNGSCSSRPWPEPCVHRSKAMKRRIRLWLSRRQEADDLCEELRAHMAIESRERMEQGESREQAERAARRDFGNVVRIQEDVREAWGWA